MRVRDFKAMGPLHEPSEPCRLRDSPSPRPSPAGRRRMVARFLETTRGYCRFMVRMHAKRNRKGAFHDCLGFTLIEVLISAALMALILVCAYACLSACLSSQKMIEPRADVLQNARVAMTLMSADLRNACPLSSDYALLGMQRMLGDAEADNLDFATHNYTPRRPQESDYCEVSYFVDKDQSGQMCLYRRRNPTLAPDPLSGGSREEIAEGVIGVRFEYFDGTDWYDKWGNAENPEQNVGLSEEQANQKGLPEAVRITLMFDSDPKSNPAVNAGAESSAGTPLVFQTVTRLMLAGQSQASPSSGGNAAPSF